MNSKNGFQRAVKHFGKKKISRDKMPSKSKPTKKKSEDVNFTRYIKPILVQIHPGLMLSREVQEYFQNLITAMIHNFCEYAVIMMNHARNKTLTSRDIQSAVQLFLVDLLVKHAVSNGIKAVTKYTSYVPSKKGERVSNAKKAGLTIPPSSVYKMLKKCVPDYVVDYRISPLAGVYLAAIVEYLCAEILELARDEALKANKNKLEVIHVKTVFEKDDELSRTFCRIRGFEEL